MLAFALACIFLFCRRILLPVRQHALANDFQRLGKRGGFKHVSRAEIYDEAGVFRKAVGEQVNSVEVSEDDGGSILALE